MIDFLLPTYKETNYSSFVENQPPQKFLDVFGKLSDNKSNKFLKLPSKEWMFWNNSLQKAESLSKDFSKYLKELQKATQHKRKEKQQKLKDTRGSMSRFVDKIKSEMDHILEVSQLSRVS